MNKVKDSLRSENNIKTCLENLLCRIWADGFKYPNRFLASNLL